MKQVSNDIWHGVFNGPHRNASIAAHKFEWVLWEELRDNLSRGVYDGLIPFRITLERTGDGDAAERHEIRWDETN